MNEPVPANAAARSEGGTTSGPAAPQDAATGGATAAADGTERGSSTYATGGGGVSFAHRVAAVYLAGMLTGARRAEASELPVRKVSFQTGPAHPVDDLLVECGDEAAVVTLAVACQATPDFVPSHDDTVKLVASLLSEVAKFDTDTHRCRPEARRPPTGHRLRRLLPPRTGGPSHHRSARRWVARTLERRRPRRNSADRTGARVADHLQRPRHRHHHGRPRTRRRREQRRRLYSAWRGTGLTILVSTTSIRLNQPAPFGPTSLRQDSKAAGKRSSNAPKQPSAAQSR